MNVFISVKNGVNKAGGYFRPNPANQKTSLDFILSHRYFNGEYAYRIK